MPTTKEEGTKRGAGPAWLRDWLDRRFRMEEINGGGTCPTYLFRWTVFRAKSFQLYLHHFVGDDWSYDLHDHPKRFISFGLRGGYVEETPCASCNAKGLKHETQFRAPWLRSFPANYAHRLRLEGGRDCWTLVLVLKNVRMWGFWRAGRFIPWREYVNSPDAREHRSCP